MTYSVYTDTDWLFPDTAESGRNEAILDCARGGHAGFQLLGGACAAAAEAKVELRWEEECGLKVSLYELRAVGVNENTSPKLMTTTDYESCRAFVTRKAPFAVYDALSPFDGLLHGERFALYVCIEAAAEEAPRIHRGSLKITAEGQTVSVPVVCTVHRTAVPPLKEARLGMLNFFNYEDLGAQHGVPRGSEAYWDIFRKYVRAQLALRCTHILLPPGEPIRENGRVTGFDFSCAERAGRIAVEEGAVKLCGGHVAHWNEWNDTAYFLVWAPQTGIASQEGYLQLRRYFTQWAEIVTRNGWHNRMTQALADEPQVNNADTYRVLAAIFRKFLPGIPILDAVESTDLGGGVDIWVPKQDTYEKWRDAYEALKAAGETMWFYTCAFPGGAIMNRSMDLPLTVSRAVLWMGARYRLSGFLHWGFNYYIGEDIWHKACCPHKGALLPAGDAHIVYPGSGAPWRSMRFEAQRGGAEDYELLMQAIDRDAAYTDALIQRVCTTFRSYAREGNQLLDARRALLEYLDAAE